MKKLLFVFGTLFSFILSSCTAQDNNVTRFNEDGTPVENAETTTETPQDTPTDEAAQETATTPETQDKTIESIKEDSAKNTPTVKNSKVVDLTVTSFKGAHLETKTSYNLVKGTVPKEAYTLTVNGYKLQKHVPGETAWSYIASTQLKTLKKGTNDYVVKAMDKTGKEIDSTKFSITYNETIVHTLPAVGPSLWLTLLLAFGLLVTFRGIKLINSK